MRNEMVLRAPRRNLQRIPRHVRWGMELQQYRGLEAAARVKAASHVARVGMMLTAELSAEEGILIQQCPLVEPRLKGIVDHFALVAATEVIEMGL